MNKYLTGQKVVVYGRWIGMVTNEEVDGVWVKPLVDNDVDHHSCYAHHNVDPYYQETRT